MLDHIFESARAVYWDAVHSLWPGTALVQLERERDWLRLRLRRGYDCLIRQRRTLQETLTRIAQNDKHTTALTYRIESYLQTDNRVKAYHHALELDRLRKTLERDRGQLPELDRAYQNRVADITDMEQRVAEIEERLEAQRLRPVNMNAW